MFKLLDAFAANDWLRVKRLVRMGPASQRESDARLWFEKNGSIRASSTGHRGMA